MATTTRHSLLTPRVRRAQYELLQALEESISQTDFSFDVVEGKLSAVLSDVWNEAEKIAKTLLLPLEEEGESAAALNAGEPVNQVGLSQ